MPGMEQIELQRHRPEIIADVAKLIDRWRAIFDWDVPEIDQKHADKLIISEARKALDQIERDLIA
jgi:hypothetical protein